MQQVMLSTVLVLLCSLANFGHSTECPPDWRPPEVHGIRLGMSVKQVKSRLPFLKIPPPDKYDVRWAFLYVTTNAQQRRRLPRVFGIEMWFLKNRLVRYNIHYYGSDKPEAMRRFIDSVAKSFNLSERMKVSHGTYECGNISIGIAEENKRIVSLRDLRGEATLDRRVDESYGIK
jgi:hypothetical protein